VSTANLIPKIIKNSNVDGNVTLEKLNYTIAVHFSFMVFNPSNAELNPICHLLALLEAHPKLHVSRIRVNITYFFHQLCTLFYNKPKKTEEIKHFQYKYTFYIKTTNDAFQSSTTIIPQGILTSYREIKQYI
jgi:hypothetical protein